MRFNYNPIALQATNLITKFGKEVMVSRLVTDFDSVTGEVTITGASRSRLQAVRTGPVSKSSGIENEIPEGRTISETTGFLLSVTGSTFTPKALDLITCGNDVYEIFGSSVLTPGGTEVIYKVYTLFKHFKGDQPEPPEADCTHFEVNEW